MYLLLVASLATEGSYPEDALSKFCCQEMKRQLTVVCSQYELPEDCPDVLIVRGASSRDYGIRIHDGGSSMVRINYCPWCGVALHGLKKLKTKGVQGSEDGRRARRGARVKKK